MTVTGGRVFPTTIVVTPNTQLAFKNFDPFKHRIYVSSATGQKLLQPEDLQPNAVRKWAAQGPGKYEVRVATSSSEKDVKLRTPVELVKEVRWNGL